MPQMMETTFYTLTVPRTLGDTGSPTPNTTALAVTEARQRPLRVLCRNVSPDGGNIFISDDQQSLQNNPGGSNAFVLPAGASEVFVLAPLQRLFCATTTSGALMSVSVSQALPVDEDGKSGVI